MGGQTEYLKVLPEIGRPNRIVKGCRRTRGVTDDWGHLVEITQAHKGLAAKGEVVQHNLLEELVHALPHDLLGHGHLLPYDQVGLTQELGMCTARTDP
jgi:hypothetical protein